MHRWNLLAALAVAITAAPHAACEAPADGDSLGAMSFNVRYGTARDGDNAWPLRKDLLVETIAMYDPDIVGLQEALEFQVLHIAEQLPHYRWLGIGRERDGGGESVAVLYRKDRLLPLEYGTFWLSETPEVPASKSWDSSLPRIVTWVKFHDVASERRFHVYNSHFDHRGREARLESARMMTDHAKDLPEDHPVIMMGDFNAIGGDSDPWRVFIEAGYTDAWEAVEEPVGPVTTWSAFGPPDWDSNRRIDWILYRGPLTAVHCETVIHNDDGRYPSDHYPVYARLEWADGAE